MDISRPAEVSSEWLELANRNWSREEHIDPESGILEHDIYTFLPPEIDEIPEPTTYEEAYQTLLDYREALYNHNLGSNEEVARREAEIDSYVDRVVRTAVSEEETKAILAAGELAKWRLCKPVGTDLPENVYIGFEDELVSGVIVGGKLLSYKPDDKKNILTGFGYNGSKIEFTDNKLIELREKAISLHPFVQKCFALESDSENSQDRPLTPTELLSQKAVLRSQAKEKHGLNNEAEVAGDYNASSWLTGKEVKLDEATIPDRKKTDDPRDKLIEYILKYALERTGEGTDKYSMHKGNIVKYSIYKGYVACLNPNGSMDLLDPGDFSTHLTEALDDDYPDGNFGINNIVADRIVLYLVGEFRAAGIKEVFKSAPIEKSDLLIKDPKPKKGLRLSLSVGYEDIAQESPKILEISESEIEAAQSYSTRTLEAIRKSDRPKYRIIRGVETVLKDVFPDADMVISDGAGELEADQDFYEVIRVLGYSAVSAMVENIEEDPKIYMYYQKEKQDLYRKCSTRIPGIAKSMLVDYFEDRHMTKISEKIKHSGTDFSVADLEKIIKKMSDYTTPEEGAIWSNTWQIRTKGGRAQMQCSGAATLLSEALNTIWPNSSSYVSGEFITTSLKEQKSSRHAQVLFTDPDSGEKFMLDPTPGRQRSIRRLLEKRKLHKPRFKKGKIDGRIVDSTDSKKMLDEVLLEEDLTEPCEIKPANPLEKDAIKPEEIDQHNEKILAEASDFLKAYFGVETERELYRSILGTNGRKNPRQIKYNPLVKALSALKNPSDKEQVESAIEFVEKYSEMFEIAKPNSKRFVGLKKYNAEILDQMEKALKSIKFQDNQEAKTS